MPRALTLALLLSLLRLPVSAAEPAPQPAWNVPTWNIETGQLWEIGTGTPIAYRIVPTMLSWRSARAFGWDLSDGSTIAVRHRLTLIGTWFLAGPETHYIGFSGSPSVEWWNKEGSWGLYTGSGGGAGVVDSQGVHGSLGQDFTFNWFIRGGLEHITAGNRHLSIGIMYQHMSNGGQTKPNPGIDALGFTLGWALKY